MNMKRFITFSIIALFLAAGTFAQEKNQEKHKQLRKIGSFDKVRAAKGINVTLIEGTKEQAEITIVNGTTADVVTELINKRLTVKMKTKIYKDVAVQVFVTYVTIREIEAGSGASIDAENTITADKLLISGGPDSKIVLDIDVNALEASVSAGRIELEGKTKSQVVKASTGGKYLSYNLTSDETIAKANIGGRVEVTVNESLKATALNGGTVNYKGDPSKIDKKISFGGKVNIGE